jgi:diguanylate cyclase (GGDEF)-like protein/putative nucleotidyltransferase with HDIG domain
MTDKIIERPSGIVTVRQNESITAAAAKMLNEKIGCLIVVDDNGKLTGLLTERDISNWVAETPDSIDKIPVSQIMTSQIISCPPGTATDKARELMNSHKIRHLPIVEDGVAVEILSIRDLMQQQLIEDREAANEVAMLSKCLKSIELNEAAEIVTKEVPKLFHAGRCVLCLFKDNLTKTEADLLSYNNCPCTQDNLRSWVCETRQATSTMQGTSSVELLENQFTYDTIPDICQKNGAKGPRLVIPLAITNPNENRQCSLTSPVLIGTQGKSVCLERKESQAGVKLLSGYLCMCELAITRSFSRELISYKAGLTREILTSHLTNASLYQHAQLTSQTDALTGVGSRKLLDDRYQYEAARAKRYNSIFSVAIIDLDNFKTINDVLGHATGDDALRKVAECMKKQKRIPDVLARYGGDEFVILMPETKAEDAVILLERIRAEVQQIKISENLSMTISCGISQFQPQAGDASSEVIRRADIALYEAKSAGRNCVKCWDRTMSKTLDTGDIEVEKIRKLKRRVAGLSEQAAQMFIQSIWGLVQTLEAKDPYAQKHSENVMCYCAGIARIMNLPPKQQEIIRNAAMIHDIGKIGIPDAIIAKPQSLTPRERSIVQQHPLIAVRILEKMSFLEQEIAIVRSHHEKWNGHGYPEGLAQTAIPIGARILAVADTFDALTSQRAYHNARTIEQAIQILVDSSGYDFDPEVVKAMLSWLETLNNQYGKTRKITTDDILHSQMHTEQNQVIDSIADKIIESVTVS